MSMVTPHTFDHDILSYNELDNGGIFWFIRLPDGYNINVGSDKKRAIALARCVSNSTIPIYQWSEK